MVDEQMKHDIASFVDIYSRRGFDFVQKMVTVVDDTKELTRKRRSRVVVKWTLADADRGRVPLFVLAQAKMKETKGVKEILIKRYGPEAMFEVGQPCPPRIDVKPEE